MSLVTSLPAVTLEVIITPIKVRSTEYRGSPTYIKITNTVSTITVFGLCTCKWGIFALENLYKLRLHFFCI